MYLRYSWFILSKKSYSLPLFCKVLSIKNCEIEVPGGEAIGLGLQRNMALKELYLSDNNLLDAGSKEIAQGIKVSETLIVKYSIY